MILLILAALLLTLLACWLWYGLEEPEAEVAPLALAFVGLLALALFMARRRR